MRGACLHGGRSDSLIVIAVEDNQHGDGIINYYCFGWLNRPQHRPNHKLGDEIITYYRFGQLKSGRNYKFISLGVGLCQNGRFQTNKPASVFSKSKSVLFVIL